MCCIPSRLYNAVLLSAVSVSILAFPVFGVDTDETVDGEYVTEEVVVTSTRTEKLYEDVPDRVILVDKDDIEDKNAHTLGEALEGETGLRVETNCPTCNWNQVRINGLDGSYTQILVDSMPIIGSMSNLHILDQIPGEMIGRIEIVKGGGSALHGGNAVAGIVNVIPVKPYTNRGVVGINYGFIGGNYVPDSNIGAAGSVVSDSGRSGVNFYGSARRREPLYYNDDDLSDRAKVRNNCFGADIFNTVFDGGDVDIHIYGLDEFRRGGNAFGQSELDADACGRLNTRIYGGGARWKHQVTPIIDYSIGGNYTLNERATYYGGGGNTETYGFTDDDVLYTEAQVNVAPGSHIISVGAQYSWEHLDDSAPGYNREVDDKYTDIGVFVQEDWAITEWVEVVAGVRADDHSEIETIIISPRGSLLLKPLKGLTTRTNFTTGFRAPQVFAKDVHMTAVHGRWKVVSNAGGLEEEKSFSISQGMEYDFKAGASDIMIGINGYYTQLDNIFEMRRLPDDPAYPNAEYYERFNGGGANMYGVEADVGCIPAKWVELKGGIAYEKTGKDEPDPVFGCGEFFRTPDVYGHARAKFTFNPIEAIVNYVYTGSMKVGHHAGVIPEDRVEDTNPFNVIGIKAGLALPASIFEGAGFKIYGGVDNILDEFQDDLDEGMSRDGSYIYGPAMPRTYYAGIKVTF